MSELDQRVREDLARQSGGEVVLHTLRPLSGGACQELFALEAELPERGRVRLVLRSDAPTSLPGSISRAREYPLVRAAHARGVRTPRPWFASRDLVRPGASAFYMDHVAGEAIGKRVVGDPRLAAARERLPGQLAEDLARIHAIGPADLPEGLLADTPDPEARALAELRAWIEALPEPRPALDLALSWLGEHRPRDRAEVLVHGDFRVGNFLVRADGLAAILDWEFAHLGHPAEDVAWLCVRDWRFGAVERPAGGLCSRERFLAAYVEAGGRPLEPSLVHWWEVLGNVRWAVGSVQQGLRYLSGQRDLELLAIARRTDEMLYEALRLIEVGP